jgi:hypothetical protein
MPLSLVLKVEITNNSQICLKYLAYFEKEGFVMPFNAIVEK